MTTDEKFPLDDAISSQPATGEPLSEPIPGGFLNPPPAPPNHYKDEQGNYVALPEDMTYGDWMLKPGKPLSARHRRLAELLAQGKTTKQIAEALGYTMARVSVLKSNTQIKQEADRLRDRAFDKSVVESLQALGPDAVNTIEEVLRSDTEKLSTRADTAKWLLEKLTGKARQEVGVDAGASLLELLKKLDDLKVSGKVSAERDVLEITGGGTPSESEDSWMDKFVTENIPGVDNEKSGGNGE